MTNAFDVLLINLNLKFVKEEIKKIGTSLHDDSELRPERMSMQ